MSKAKAVAAKAPNMQDMSDAYIPEEPADTSIEQPRVSHSEKPLEDFKEVVDKVASLENIEDDYSKDNFEESMGIQTHDEMTPQRQYFSSSLKGSQLPSSNAGSPLSMRNEKMGPALSGVKEGKEPLLKGLKLHKIPMPGQSELANVHQHKRRQEQRHSKLSEPASMQSAVFNVVPEHQERALKTKDKKSKQGPINLPENVKEMTDSPIQELQWEKASPSAKQSPPQQQTSPKRVSNNQRTLAEPPSIQDIQKQVSLSQSLQMQRQLTEQKSPKLLNQASSRYSSIQSQGQVPIEMSPGVRKVIVQNDDQELNSPTPLYRNESPNLIKQSSLKQSPRFLQNSSTLSKNTASNKYNEDAPVVVNSNVKNGKSPASSRLRKTPKLAALSPQGNKPQKPETVAVTRQIAAQEEAVSAEVGLVPSDNDQIGSFAQGSLPSQRNNGRSERTSSDLLTRQSPQFSQDDNSPKPLQPSGRTYKKTSPRISGLGPGKGVGKKKISKFDLQKKKSTTEKQLLASDEEFKDSALGESNQEFTEEMVKQMEEASSQMKQKCEGLIEKMENLIEGVLSLKELEDRFIKTKTAEKHQMGKNEAMQEKKRELEQHISESNEVKKQIDHIRKTFKANGDYEWMIETENRVKSDKKTLADLQEENRSLHQMLEKHQKLQQDSEETQAKLADLDSIKAQVHEMEHKLKKVKTRAKDDEKKFAEQHEAVVSVEERCRNMNEIIKFRQAEDKKGQKEIVTEEDLAEMDEQYQAMIYEKEENQIQQESDMNAQIEEIKKLEATIAALDKQYREVERENKMLDIQLTRNGQQTSSVTSKNLSKISAANGQLSNLVTPSLSINSRLRNQGGKKPSISTSVDLTGRLGAGRFNTIKTPGAGVNKSSIDRAGNSHLEQVLSRQERSVAKSLIVDAGTSLGNKFRLPQSTRNKGYASQNRDIATLNVSVIPPPTSIHQREIITKRARKFSAKMSTAIGSERGNSRENGVRGRYLGRPKRSISQINH